MERETKMINLGKAKELMSGNFIGPDELRKISRELKIPDPYQFKKKIPAIPFDENFLKKNRKDYLLILGMPEAKDGERLTLNKLRSLFGVDPRKSEPCFYSQDWYLKERFAKDAALDFKWYLIRKTVSEGSRGKDPDNLLRGLKGKEVFPQAVLTAFGFFSYYLLNKGKILWKNDFIWCSDKDHNGDRIYTGRYVDSKKINKSGFNIHRHLSIRPCYGLASQIR